MERIGEIFLEDDGGDEFMHLHWHSDIHSFLEQALEPLEQDEALNKLMLGICLRIQRDPTYYDEVELATVMDADRLVLAALRTVPEKLMIYGILGKHEEAMGILVGSLLERGSRIPGVIGPKELAQPFAAIWSKQTNSRLLSDMHMRVYELRKVNKEVIGEGRLRLAEESDLEFLIEGVAEFEKDAGLSAIPDLEKCRKMAQRRLADQSVFLWEHEGRVVSIAAKSRPTKNGVTINLVYTPKELRGRGYATSCVATLSQQLLDSGYSFCSLFTDLANPTSNSIYQKIGYRPRGDFDAYRFEY